MSVRKSSAPDSVAAPTSADNKSDRSLLIVLVAVPAVALMATAGASLSLSLPTLCIYKRLTSLPCGGCGMTRAFVFLGEGQFEQAVLMHPLSPLVAIWLLWTWCDAVVKKGKSPGRERAQMPQLPTSATALLLAAVLALHVVRQFGWWLPHH